MATIFTSIMNGDIPGSFVWADDVCTAFATIEPHTAGHVLVVSREEVDSFTDADDALLAHLISVAKIIGNVQKTVFDAPRAGLAIEGFGVPHLHLHVMPLQDGKELDHSSLRSDVPMEEINAAMEKIRGGLREAGYANKVPAVR
ncbi:HIT family protein [Actinomyces vulturis]|uniref:HIT family protein n=1 Tax=Actinomyces vulturis TaxID=1857645 RepID=UPI00082BCFD6|nr:HIT family protein [Actinomyces vulturis]